MKKAKLLMSFLLLPAIAASASSQTATAASSGALSALRAATENFRADYDSLSATEDAAAELNIELASEGFVLLKNKDALPLSATEQNHAKVTVLGQQADTLATGGSGSGGQNKPAGENTPDSPMTIFQALDAAHIDYNPSVKEKYEEESNDPSALSNGNAWENGHYMEKVETPTSSTVDFDGSHYASLTTGGSLDGVSLEGYNETALVVFSRTGAEGNDNLAYGLPNTDNPDDHYLQLNTSEKELVAYAKKNFNKVIIIVNSPAAMELGALEDDDEIDGILWIGQTGWNGIMALGKILNGEVNPSGKTVDIYSRDFATDPTWYNFGDYRQANYILNGTAIDESEDKSGSGVSAGSSIGLGYDASYTEQGIQDAGKAVVDYAEGIYMGYRYYETVYAELLSQNGKEAADTWYEDAVVYPFGYGLSYTTFSQEIVSVSTNTIGDNNAKVTVKVKVTNTGEKAGKEVVQLYNHAPYAEDEIEKADAVLVGFAKTDVIQPQNFAEVEITVDAKDLSSFDYNDANGNGNSGYELEEGSYSLSVRGDSHTVLDEETITVSKTLTWDEDGDPTTPNNIFSQADNAWEQYNTLSSQWAVDDTDHYLHRTQLVVDGIVALEEEYSAGEPNYLQEQLGWLIANDGADNVFKPEAFIYLNGQEPDEAYLDHDNRLTKEVETDYENVWVKTNDDIPETWTQGEGKADASGLYAIELAEMKGLSFDDPKWDEFMNQLTWQELVNIVQDGGYGSKAIDTIGKPEIQDHDGPGQLRKEASVTLDGNGYAWVCEAVIGSTWNQDLAYRQGRIVGNEGIFLDVTGWYGPGANIHRNPLAGRNFEYYSQDPIQSGYILANVVKGFQDMGGHTYMKHAFLNDQETSRSGIVTFATEQAIREIYAKPFEIAVREGNANGLMTSFNRIGLQSSVSYAINQQMYINEWGYNGMSVTDAYYSGCGWDSEAMVRGNVIPLNSIFAIFPPATAIEGTWDDSLRDGKGGVYVKDASGKDIESPTQYYYARMTAKRALYTYAHSNAFTGLTAKNVLSAKTVSFTSGESLTHSLYSEEELTQFRANMKEVFGSDDAYEVTTSGLPTGMRFDVETGALTGTAPTTAGYYSFDINVTGTGKLSYISRTTTIQLNITSTFTSGESVNVDFLMPVSLVEGENYFPDVDYTQPNFTNEHPEYEGMYLRASYSAEGLPEGLTMDPETGTITGTPTGNYYNGQQIPVTITLTTQYGMPWGFMPGYMVQEQVYTTTVYFEYQGDNDGPVSIYDIEITETDEGTQITIILTNGEKYTFTIKNGQDGEDGKPGEAGQPGADGEDGQPGADGKPGADGADGVGIADITVNEDGQLVITLTDGTTKTVDVPSSESGNGIAIASLVLSIIGVLGAGAAAFLAFFLKKKSK